MVDVNALTDARSHRTGTKSALVLSVLSIVLLMFMLGMTANARFDPVIYRFVAAAALPPLFAYSILTIDTQPVRDGMAYQAANVWYALVLVAGFVGLMALLSLLQGPVALFILVVIFPLAGRALYGLTKLFLERTEKGVVA